LAVAQAPARPRPGGGRLFIIVGLILALAAGAGVYFLGGALGGGGGIGGGPSTKVVVAKQAIPARHALTADDLDIQSVSGSFTSGTNIYTNKTDAVGLIAEIQISKGSVITADMLAKDAGLIPSGAAPAYLPLATGYVAYTIPTGEQQGVAGHITLGDYFTVIASASITVFATGSAAAPRLPARCVSRPSTSPATSSPSPSRRPAIRSRSRRPGSGRVWSRT